MLAIAVSGEHVVIFAAAQSSRTAQTIASTRAALSSMTSRARQACSAIDTTRLARHMMQGAVAEKSVSAFPITFTVHGPTALTPVAIALLRSR